MGKHGPCCHCGVTSTPLWRNGPPEKPVLCNACGSRWRTKGSLANYIPLHARESFNSDELKVPKIKRTSFKPKEQKLQKKRQSNNALESECAMQFCDQNFRKIAEGDTSNRSSSESAISSSESVHFGITDASEVTGSVQSNVWDLPVPSKKRTSMTLLKPSPVEKLTKDLCSILHEEQASNLSGTLEVDLLYESGAPLGSSEIGYGGVLIKHPNSESVAEESEASSFLVDKSYIINEGYSEQKSTVRSPKRVCRSGGMNPHSRCSTHLEASVVSKVTDNTEDTVDHEGACFSSRGIFSPPDSDRSSMLAPAQFIADSSFGGLLLDVPSIASFPEAELLYHPWRRKADQNDFAMESGAEASDRPSSSFGNKQSKH